MLEILLTAEQISLECVNYFNLRPEILFTGTCKAYY